MKSWNEKKKELKSIARIENGGTVPRLDTVLKLALAMGMKLSLHGTEEAAAVSVG